jgi:hypothetical protein
LTAFGIPTSSAQARSWTCWTDSLSIVKSSGLIYIYKFRVCVEYTDYGKSVFVNTVSLEWRSGPPRANCVTLGERLYNSNQQLGWYAGGKTLPLQRTLYWYPMTVLSGTKQFVSVSIQCNNQGDVDVNNELWHSY